MQTINAYELRKNLHDYIKRAGNGEQVRVTYRGGTVAVLGPDQQTNTANATSFFTAASKFSQSLDPAASRVNDQMVADIKHQHNAEKYGV